MPLTPANARIFVLANASKPHIAEPYGRLTAWLRERGQLVGSECTGRPETVNESAPDYLIALGGDGTILHAAQAMGTRQVPIIGVNMGKLGYLADFVEQEIYQSLDQLLGADQLISPRMMLDVRVVPPAGDPWSGIALNDCVVRVGDPFRTITLEVSIDGQPLCILAGDGVILATPTGSTAHNMSCGGPIVEPSVHAIIMTPRCPHSFTHRPVVISDTAQIGIRVLPNSAGASAVLDGQRIQPVGPNWRILVSKSTHVARLVRNPRLRPLDTLITKLKWGADVT
ncbi:MAG TPA: NAD(+)/NADH kinase [Phycisphaerae bacterium]|nr:NAD(+)/NADH kinase [Phycisphaerae bacterium]